jgi:hypothetical protein
MESQWNDTGRENQRIQRKSCPNATLSTTNPTWTDKGANLDFHSERPATNRLSHGTAILTDQTREKSGKNILEE